MYGPKVQDGAGATLAGCRAALATGATQAERWSPARAGSGSLGRHRVPASHRVPWKALPNEFGSGSTCHLRLQQWAEAGVFTEAFVEMLRLYDRNDRKRGIEWKWTALDGFIVKAPKGDLTGPNPTDRAKSGTCPGVPMPAHAAYIVSQVGYIDVRHEGCHS